MTTQPQPEALRIAQRLYEASTKCDHHYSLDRTAASELERLHAECEALRKALAEKVTSDTILTDLALQGNSLFAGFEGGACRAFAQAFVDQFDNAGATNYVEVTVTDPRDHTRAFVVTLQRKAGDTPHALRTKAEAECEALRMERDALRAATGGRMGYFDDEVGKLRAECEALRNALERISGFTMSQFASINDMALECVNVANDALAARAAKEQSK